MLSKRLSRPSSAVMREKRKLPSRVAHSVTAAEKSTCRQFQVAVPLAPVEVRDARREGQGGWVAVLEAAILARKVGRYKESAVQEM